MAADFFQVYGQTHGHDKGNSPLPKEQTCRLAT